MDRIAVSCSLQYDVPPPLDCHDINMLEALNCASLGAMGSLLKKLDELLLTEDCAPNIQQLREDVGSISSKLVKLSDLHDPPLTVSYWRKDARELSYDMEDCVDKFIHAKEDEKTKMDWINEITGFETRVEEVKERYDRFNLEFVLSNPNVTETVANFDPRIENEESKPVIPLGMEGPINEILGWLKPKEDDDSKLPLKVVSILGVEGVGKSTLAQELWRKLGGEFECQAFVQAAKKPDMRMILRSILSQVSRHEPPEVCQVPKLIHDIRKLLRNKRYFITIDDLCAVSVWDAVSRAFPEDDCCSRIMTTTTIEDVALACCSYEPEHIFIMKPLSGNHSNELFIRTIYGSGKGCPQKFHDISDEITKKCGGLPLAIICIANLIASQQGAIQHWEYVRNFLHTNLRSNSTSMEILEQVMNFCYSCLPRCLKTCLLYLSVYPQNYIVLKEDLLRQWIAEGFICRTKERDTFAVASSYFDELVSLGLIQRMDINSDKKQLSYVVHPKVFGFITCKSIEENFITIIDYSQSEVALTDKIRRLSVHFGTATYAATPERFGLSQVRSFTFIGLLNSMPPLEEFKLVRVVILQLLAEPTSFSLTEICRLLLLRYLMVECNVTVELPKQMRCLKYLETLEINARVATVPSDIVHLPRLLHLRLGRKIVYRYSLPSGKVLSLDDSSWTSVHLVPIFAFPGMIPWPLQWTGYFRNLLYLDAAVRELQTYNIDVLAELWALLFLSLYVQNPTAENIHFKRGTFRALQYFKYMGAGVIFLTFDKDAMPNLWSLNIGFNARRGRNFSHILVGIQHLLNLKEIDASIGADIGAKKSDRRAAESALQDAISKHPCLVSFKVKRLDRVDGKYDPSENQNWIQETHVSNKKYVLKKQHMACRKELSNDQPVLQGKTATPMEDVKGHADRGVEQHETPAPEKPRPLLLLLVSLTAAITYQAGPNPPDGLWLDEVEGHLGGEPILLTPSPWRFKAFWYCNSVSLVTSFLSIIILLQKRVRLDKHVLENAMILDLLGLIGAYIAGSCLSISTSLHYAMALVGTVLMIHVGYVGLNHTDVFGDKTHKWLLIFATLTATITFGAAFFIENNESGWILRYRTLICWNAVSFVLSIALMLLLVCSNLYTLDFLSTALSVCMAAEVCSLLGAAEAGNVPSSKTHTYIVFVVAVVMSVAILDLLSRNRADMENDMAWDPTAQKDGSGKEWDVKYLMMLATIEAAVTCHVGLSAPVGVWHGDDGGHAAGNSVSSDNKRMQYLASTYCNAFAFATSLVIITVLLLLRSPSNNKWLVRVMNTMIVLDMLSLLVAYTASSMRFFKTFGYFSTLVIVVVVAIATRVQPAVFSKRAETPVAAATASPAPFTHQEKKLREQQTKVCAKCRERRQTSTSPSFWKGHSYYGGHGSGSYSIDDEQYYCPNNDQ